MAESGCCLLSLIISISSILPYCCQLPLPPRQSTTQTGIFNFHLSPCSVKHFFCYYHKCHLLCNFSILPPSLLHIILQPHSLLVFASHSPYAPSSLSCINEYLAKDSGRNVTITSWLNSSQGSRVGVGMIRSARGWSVKRFERSNGLYTALYKNIPVSLKKSVSPPKC